VKRLTTEGLRVLATLASHGVLGFQFCIRYSDAPTSLRIRFDLSVRSGCWFWGAYTGRFVSTVSVINVWVFEKLVTAIVLYFLAFRLIHRLDSRSYHSGLR
jgi:hypothetical protein